MSNIIKIAEVRKTLWFNLSECKRLSGAVSLLLLRVQTFIVCTVQRRSERELL